MATRYALQQVVYYDTTAGADICIIEGAARDTSSQAYAQTPSSMWSSTALTVGTQISPSLNAYLAAYPSV
jgi:hypothetical protein